MYENVEPAPTQNLNLIEITALLDSFIADELIDHEVACEILTELGYPSVLETASDE